MSAPMVIRPRSSAPRSAAPALVVALLTAIFCTGVGFGQLFGLPDLTGGTRDSGSALRRSPPAGLAIPALGIQAPVVEVTETADGSIGIPTADPAHQTGWYSPGPTPGERGVAVIVGHVDTATEPAVFRDLRQLSKGGTVEVRRRDRKVATFTVDSVETFAKTAFPVERIYRSSGPARLALITCGGAWVGGDLGYADNVIVFATLRSPP